MGIDIETEGAAPGQACPPLDIFTDDFNSNNVALVARPPWQGWLTKFGGPFTLSPPGPTALNAFDSVLVNLGVLRITISTVPPNDTAIWQPRTYYTPARFWFGKNPSMDGHAQFSEYTIVTDTSTAGVNIITTGPAVFIQQWDPNFTGMGGGYIFEFRKDLGQVLLARGIGTGGVDAGTAPGVVLIPGGGAMVAAVGDRLRVECIPQAGFNTVNCFVNGVMVGTINDNSALRPMSGFPGICFIFQGNPSVAQQTIDDYAAGPLP